MKNVNKGIMVRVLIVALLFLVGVLSARVLHSYIDLFFYVCFASSFFVLAIGILVAAIRRSSSRARLDLEKETLSVAVASLLTFVFLTTVPLNVDRLFSVWMLNNVNSQQQSLTIEELEALAYKFFEPSEGEIARRIEEQSRLGNLYVDSDGKVLITPKGSSISRFFRKISEFFDLNPKYAQG
jgi:hypothetical protein